MAELIDYLTDKAKEYPSAYRMAVDNGWSYGLVYRVLNGGDSPTLRRQIGISKHPKRYRLIVNCSPDTIARFDAQRGDMSRREWLERLIDLSDGIGEMEI